jgi:hypothetical protein
MAGCSGLVVRVDNDDGSSSSAGSSIAAAAADGGGMGDILLSIMDMIIQEK